MTGVDATTAAALAATADPAAAARFVRATQADVRRLTAHLIDEQTADDLTQDTYLRAFRALPSFRGDSTARTWLLGIARRTCADEIRRRTRERRHTLHADAPTTPADPAGTVSADALIRTLEPDRRAAFVLTQLLGLSYADAAAACNCPIGTIRSRVARARDDLLHHLEDTPHAQPRRAQPRQA